MEHQKENRPHNCPQKTRGQKITLYSLLGMTLLFIVGAIVIFPMTFEGTDKEVTIRIPANADADMVKDSIRKYLGDTFASRVMRYSRLRHIDFHKRHGQYVIPEGTSALDAMKILFRRAQTPVKVTVNGFRTLPSVTERFGEKLEFSPSDLDKLLSDSAFLASYSLKPGQALALFINDTFEYYWTDSPEKVMKKIGDNYNDFWNKERTALAHKLGLSPAQVMILASIVDEETNKADEKGKIARLYINRLNKGMLLQSDPTVRYALNDFTIKRVLLSHLKVESPFNTYLHKGLPPAPIRTTDKATLDSILHSAPNNYLYMCAKENLSGYHNFTDNFEEHKKNAKRYQLALDLKGIK